MKIEKMEISQEYIALKTAFVTALRRVESVEFVRVVLWSDTGASGVGEAPATVAITGEDCQIIINSLRLIEPKILDKTPQEALEILHQSSIGSSAKAALDIALVTLLAEQNSMSLGEYLGLKEVSSIECDITISLGESKKMLHDAAVAFASGIKLLKIKLGSDIAHAIEVTNLLTQELRGASLLIDANQAWSLESTLQYLQNVEIRNIALIEQPVIASDLDALKKITQSTNIPILADEAAFTLEDVQKIIKTQSANMINIKLMKCGGVSKAVEILEYARAEGVRCMLGSMLEGPYSINAALYLAFVYRDVIKFVDLDSPLLYKEIPSGLDFFYEASTISLKPSLALAK